MSAQAPHPHLPHLLLLDALIRPLPEAEDAWRRWRASVDLDQLDHPSFLMLPSLAGRIQDWIVADPQRDILLGICRRAWSQNQVQRKLLADSVGVLRNSKIERVAAVGPVDWGALYWPERSVRPIGRIDLLVEPALVRGAIEALARAGWSAPDPVPDLAGATFLFAPGVRLRSSSGDVLWLHWRALPNTDISISRPPILPLEPARPGQPAPFAIPAEHSLIAALGGAHGDGMDWRSDALMICRAQLDWDAVAALVRWRSQARARIDELRRDWGVDVPAMVTKPAWSSGPERLLASTLRVYRRSKRALC